MKKSLPLVILMLVRNADHPWPVETGISKGNSNFSLLQEKKSEMS